MEWVINQIHQIRCVIAYPLYKVNRCVAKLSLKFGVEEWLHPTLRGICNYVSLPWSMFVSFLVKEAPS